MSDTPFETQPLQMPPRADAWHSSGRSWWKRGMMAIGVLVAVASAAAIIPGVNSSRTLGPVSIHTIKRGNLLVTVTEQGTLRSSNNTEIKCKVRGNNTIIWVIESGTQVNPGDELLRLDTLFIEEEISERTKYAHLARSAAARSKANVARAELAISEYLQGRFVSALKTLQKDLAIAESKLLSAKNMLGFAKMMAESDYASELEVEEKQFAVAQADEAGEVGAGELDVVKADQESQLALCGEALEEFEEGAEGESRGRSEDESGVESKAEGQPEATEPDDAPDASAEEAEASAEAEDAEPEAAPGSPVRATTQQK